jgi:ABC-type lipoprotein export system ATPase subunit
MDILTDFHKREGKTIIVVTHDPHIAEYSEKIVDIKDGEIIINHKQGGGILWNK